MNVLAYFFSMVYFDQIWSLQYFTQQAVLRRMVHGDTKPNVSNTNCQVRDNLEMQGKNVWVWTIDNLIRFENQDRTTSTIIQEETGAICVHEGKAVSWETQVRQSSDG